jgi:ADP-heptose:LPS heptosyltransferase
MTIGYTTNDRGKLFTHTVPYLHDDYEVESFSRLIELLGGIPVADLDKPFLTVPAESLQNVKARLKAVDGKRIVALFPGGSILERQWGSSRFHQIAAALVDRGFYVIVVGGPEDRKSGKEIMDGLAGGMDLCGQLSLVETAAVLKGAALLITGDSGIMHIGFGLGIKTLSLFGPGIEKKWAPRGPGHIVINKKLPCSPCTKFGYTPKCKINAECMKQISVDEVLETALEMLEG